MFSSFSTLTKALTDLFIFLPYYFSVDTLVKTLFAPWKRVVPKEKRVGFSFSTYFEDVGFDMVSRGIGFMMRSVTLFTYLILQILFVPISMIIVVMYGILIAPIHLIFKSFEKSPEERYSDAKQVFISTHVVDPANVPAVEAWFDTWYGRSQHAAKWWELDNLFNTVPLARDWAQGYTPTLDRFSVDLSAMAGRHNDRPMTIGREKELKEIESVLCKTNGANVLMVGEEGVGKTTIVESLAYRIYAGRGNPLLAFKRLIEINLEKILASDTDIKQRESILEDLFDEANRADNIIFVINNFDKYLSGGEGRVDLSIPLEKFLRSNRIHVIGITTPFAYQKYLYSKQSLKSYFTLVEVPEITADVSLQILLEHVHRFELRYQVSIPYETLVASIQKSGFFISDVPFPEKALQVLDDCCNAAKNMAVVKGQVRMVMPALVDMVLSNRAHVPTTLSQAFKDKLLTIQAKLSDSVIGQEEALHELSSALQRAFLMVGKRKKPLASFLFLGPTGVGKTETAKTLAQEFFDSTANMIRFDMSEFQRVEDISKLIGDIATGNPGLLVSAIREKPYGVLLLDELEKAHHDLLNIFLTLFDEGYITDSTGKHVDCKSLVVIATSNAGAVEFYQGIHMPTSLQAYKPNLDIMSFLIEKRYFTPEFLNRFDGVIAFKPLDNAMALLIGRRMVQGIATNVLSLHDVTITVSDTTLQDVIVKHFNPANGARDLQRAIQEYIENVVAQKILTGEAQKGVNIAL